MTKKGYAKRIRWKAGKGDVSIDTLCRYCFAKCYGYGHSTIDRLMDELKVTAILILSIIHFYRISSVQEGKVASNPTLNGRTSYSNVAKDIATMAWQRGRVRTCMRLFMPYDCLTCR